MTPRRYGSRRSPIATNDDYGRRFREFVDSLTFLSPMRPAAESLLYSEDYPVAPFATPRDRFDNLMEEPEYQSLLTEAGMSGQGLPVTAPGIVIGAKAKNFPKALAEKFEEVEAEKLSKMHPAIRDNKGPDVFGSSQQANREAFLETGVYRGPDGKLRYEIDDSAAEYRPGGAVASNKAAGLLEDEFLVDTPLTHEKLFGNYPDLSDMPLNVKEIDARGYYYPAYTDSMGYPHRDEIYINKELFPAMQSGKSTLLHELQHAIQRREGFTFGGGTGKARRLATEYLRKLNDALPPGATRYRHLQEDREIVSKADLINYFDKISKADRPRQGSITNTMDWYAHSTDILKRLGPQPKRSGPELRNWVKGAARILKDYHRYQTEDDFIKKYGPRLGKERLDAVLDLVGDDKKIRSRKRSIDRQIDKVMPAAREEKRVRDLEAKLLYGMTPYDLYQRIGGEAEARMVQKRMDYTPEERAATFPLDDYDVPLNELILTGLLD